MEERPRTAGITRCWLTSSSSSDEESESESKSESESLESESLESSLLLLLLSSFCVFDAAFDVAFRPAVAAAFAGCSEAT